MVSIIIPTYNRSENVIESIESVLNQTYQDIEIIVVDDGSTDDTMQKVKSVNDSRVNYIQLEKNYGQSYARNKGASIAKGECLAFQDSDDSWYRNKLELQLGFMKTAGTDMCFCQFTRNNEIYPYDELSKKILGIQLFDLLLQVPLIDTSTIVCKKDCFLSISGFDSQIRCFEDYEFSLRFAEKYTISYLGKNLLDKKSFEGGVNSDSNANEGLRVRCLIMKKYMKRIQCLNLMDTWIEGIRRFVNFCDKSVYEEEYNSLLYYIDNQI